MRSLLWIILALIPVNAFSQAEWKADFKYQELNNRPGLEVRYANGDRDAFEIAAAGYKLTGDLLAPNLLKETAGAKPWLFIEITDHQGNVYSSANNPGKTRINLYRRGPYYCEIHWFDHQFVSTNGTFLQVKAEITLYCYPDKIKGSIKLFSSADAGLAGIRVKGKNERELESHDLKKGQTLYLNFDLTGETEPLADQAFTLKKGTTPVWYDRRTGAYTVGTETASGFQEQFFNQPNGYEEAAFTIQNDATRRKIYICHKTLKGEGIVEGGVILDETGHPLPILVQVSKNFNGEKEERFYNPADTAFSETYFPLYLEPYEKLDISSLHLYQNWGRHMTKHWSSLGFFMDYFHSSTGVTETTCYIPFKFGHKTGISIGDFRAMSQETFWSGQPQHDNVGGHTFMTYFDGKQWNYSEYRGTTYKSTGANWCNVEMEYLSSDGCIRLLLDIWEAPQDDEVRSFFTARYQVVKPVVIEDARANFRFMDISTAQQSLRYQNYAYTDESGNVVYRAIDFSQSPFCVKGQEISSTNSFAAVYGEPKGSNGIMIRKFETNTGIKPAFSIQQKTHIPEPHDTTVNEHKVYTPDLAKGDIRFSLVPSTDRLDLKPGDEITINGFWLPYGEPDGAKTPTREIVAYGKDQPRVVEITKGKVIGDLPVRVQLENNQAQFTFRGGLDVVPVIASGLTSYRYPALYEKIGGQWELVRQNHNNPLDGNQLFCDRDGKFGAVFLIRTNGEKREFRITSGNPYQAKENISIKPLKSAVAAVTITNPFEDVPLKLLIENRVEGQDIKWNESSGKSFWYTDTYGDTLSGARITGFENHVAVQYWWQNSKAGSLNRSPKLELQINKGLAGNFKTFVYVNGQLSEYQNIKHGFRLPAGELGYNLQPGIIVIYNATLDYSVGLAIKNASAVYQTYSGIGVVMKEQNCPEGRRKVVDSNVYLIKGSPSVLQQIIENEMPVWKPEGPVQAKNLIYRDNRPTAKYRMDAEDAGLVLSYGLGPDSCDYLGAREAVINRDKGTFYLFYDGAGPKGWLTCLATSRDLINWDRKGKILDFGKKGDPDEAAATSPWIIKDGRWWHMFYLGTPNTTPAPDYIPSFPYLTLKAKSKGINGPWVKQPEVVPFRPKENSFYSSTCSPGYIIKRKNEFLMFLSAADFSIKRTLCIARTANLDKPWVMDSVPIVPPSEQVENSSAYYEPTNKTWFLFTNHIGYDKNGEYTDAIWVYWSKDPEKWNPDHKAVVLDGSNCKWSHLCIGMPGVIPFRDRLAILYDAPGGNSVSHMRRSIGLAWLKLPLQIPNTLN